MCAEKLTQVTDYLHGSIPLTRLEKGVLSTEAFNRLHNILQNSSAYLTYPSNRHSRFAHSVGVLHLAGEIFWSSFVNAKDEDQGRLIADVQREIGALKRSREFGDRAGDLLPNYRVGAKLDSLNYGTSMEPVLRRRLAGSLTEPAAAAAFLVLFQAVRLTGLLHDLGHPPFSHVVEFALDDLLKTVSTKEEGGSALTQREQNFLNILHRFQPEEPAPFQRTSIHEPIGRELAADVLRSAVRILPSEDERFWGLVVTYLALDILSGSSSLFEAIHSIVDGSLDADRLDYVARDALMTGFTDGGFRYTRLLNSFRLKYRNDRPLFLPSVQALSTIEEFFERRLSLYIFVVYHHRVVKTDGLLRKVVAELGKDYLADTKADSETEGDALPTDISGLWRVLDPSGHVSPLEKGDHYLQWDDAWLLTVLRKSYFSRQHHKVGTQLEEFLSNRKHYYSLFKRSDSFAAIDETFLDSLGAEFKFEPLRQEAEAVSGRSPQPRRSERQLYQAVEDYYYEVWPEPGSADGRTRAREAREKYGFFLVNVFHLFRALQLPAMLVVRNAAKRLQEQRELIDVFSVEKTLRPGVDGDFELLRGDEIITLRELSEVVEQLERRVRLFPGFFVYVYRPEGFSEEDLAGMRGEFATLLADEFKIMVADLSRKEMD